MLGRTYINVTITICTACCSAYHASVFILMCIVTTVHFVFQKSPVREEPAVEGQLDFEEFVHYLQDYEKDLKLVVKSLDKKHSGETSVFITSCPRFLYVGSFKGLLYVYGCTDGYLVCFKVVLMPAC